MKKDTKIGFIITYFHTSNESLNLLKKNIEIIGRENYYLVLASHSPIDVELQNLCDFYIYQSKNIVDNRKYSHGVAESNLIEMSVKHLKDQNIEWTYKVTYDIEINDVNRFLDWRVEGYQFISCNWGDNIICTNSFFSKVDFLLENITFYRTIEEMFSLNTVLENCWEHSFRQNRVLDKIYSFSDKHEFYGQNKIDILYYNYNDIEFSYSEEDGKFYLKNTNPDINEFDIKVYDYYTDLCIYNNSNFELNSGYIYWFIPPFFNNGRNNKNGYYLETIINGNKVRKNILITDFNHKHDFSKKFINYREENVNFLFEYLNGFYKMYSKLDFENIRNFVDLGANYGMSSIFFIERGIKTYMIDADSRMIDLLNKNFGKNSKNKIIHKAVYSHDGEIDFYEDDDCSMTSSINLIDVNNKDQNRNKNVVECITPNNLIENYIDEDFIDLMKIDIEGAEYELFKTILDENLIKVNNFLIEYHNNNEYKVLDIIKKLTINDFKFKFMDEGYPIENKGGLIYAWK